MLTPGKVTAGPLEAAKAQRMTPKDYILEWFQQKLSMRPLGPGDRILVLKSGTGSGKSTTLGPELFLKFKANVVVTQPRILTATDIPLDIAKEYAARGIRMGENIGYQTGDFKFKAAMGITFVTIGVLAQQLKTMTDEQLARTYKFIVIDECHDRSLELDIALSLAKALVHRNWRSRDCPFLVCTSATFNAVRYCEWLGADPAVSMIEVQGLNYPIKEIFPRLPIDNYVEYGTRLILAIHSDNHKDYTTQSNRFRDILMFMSGAAPIKEARKILEDLNDQAAPFVVISLTGESNLTKNLDFQNIFKPLSSIEVRLPNNEIVQPLRRVILATNVSETGVTIDTLRYVIDSGYTNVAIFDPVWGSHSLLPSPVTQASARQREGRVGRRAPGNWYPLYPRSVFESMQLVPFPNIHTTDITSTILGLAVKTTRPDWDGDLLNVPPPAALFDPHQLDLLDSPSADSLAYSTERLYVLGLVDSEFTPTIMGLIANRMPRMDVELARMILHGYYNGTSIGALVTIAAFMQCDRKADYKNTRPGAPKYTPATPQQDDFLEVLSIWDEFITAATEAPSGEILSHLDAWCLERGLVYDGLLKVIENRDSIIAAMVEMGLDPFCNGSTDPRLISECVLEGFRLNSATLVDGSYVLDHTHEKIAVDASARHIVIRSITFRESLSTKRWGFSADRFCIVENFDRTFCVS
jgi:HrpA-like RNA helicase